MTINETERQSAITSRGGRRRTQLAGDHTQHSRNEWMIDVLLVVIFWLWLTGWSIRGVMSEPIRSRWASASSSLASNLWPGQAKLPWQGPGTCYLSIVHDAFISERYITWRINSLECRGNYSATSNDMKLVHWPLMSAAPPSPLLAVPNVTAHPLTASVTNFRIAV